MTLSINVHTAVTCFSTRSPHVRKVTRASSAGNVTRVAMRTSTMKLLMMAVAGGASREALRSSASLERRLAAILSTGSALSHLALGGVRLALRP